MQVRPAGPADRPQVVATMMAAFAFYPAWRFFAGPAQPGMAPPGTPDAAAVSALLAGYFFDKRAAAGTIWMTGGAEAVALWDAPDQAAAPAAGSAAGVPAGAAGELERSFRAAAGEQVWARLARYDEAVAAVRPPGPLWYLGVLATRPGYQGRGLAGRVLAPALAAADAQRLPCGLETSTRANCEYYRRHGFAVTAEVRVPDGPATWWLQREPRPA
jgi:ribosomal protein S18 acetylase RimI-like enzyme